MREKKPTPTAEDERTNVMDMYSYRYDTGLTLQILDFGGQEVYNITKSLLGKFFIRSNRNNFAVAVNLHDDTG